MNQLIKEYGVWIALAASLALYSTERNLGYEKNHKLDLNDDCKVDSVYETGYKHIFSRYEVFINDERGIFSEDKSFSKKDISSKLKQ